MDSPFRLDPGKWSIKYLECTVSGWGVPRGRSRPFTQRNPDEPEQGEGGGRDIQISTNHAPGEWSQIHLDRCCRPRGGGGFQSRCHRLWQGRCARFVLALFGQVWREQKKKKKEGKHNGAFHPPIPSPLQRGQRRRGRVKKGVVWGNTQRGPRNQFTFYFEGNPTANARGGGDRGAPVHLLHVGIIFLLLFYEIRKLKNWKIKNEIRVMRMTERRELCGEEGK